MRHKGEGEVRPTTTYPAVVGALLAQARGSRSLSQRDLGSQVGVSQPTWSKIEMGKASVSLEQLLRACEALDRQPGQLLSEADRVVAGLEAQGVTVRRDREPPAISKGEVLIAAAALVLLIASIKK